MGTTETNKYLLESMGIKFDFPKPVELVSFIISSITSGEDIILDSFAGSGTTAHSILYQNSIDQQKRKFILVEMEDYANTKTSQRIKNVICGFEYKNKQNPKLNAAFDFYELGPSLFIEDEMLNEEVGIEKIRNYIFYTETTKPLIEEVHKDNESFLGKYNETSYYFYYKQEEITTLDHTFLSSMRTKAEQYVIYADNCLLTKDLMTKYHIIFKKIPRDITRF
jgi:adenine-specific DNA-methyltransferase